MCLFDLVQETDRCLTCVRSTTLWLAAKVRGQGQNSTKRGSVSPPLQYLIHPGLSGTRGRPAFVLGCFFLYRTSLETTRPSPNPTTDKP